MDFSVEKLVPIPQHNKPRENPPKRKKNTAYLPSFRVLTMNRLIWQIQLLDNRSSSTRGFNCVANMKAEKHRDNFSPHSISGRTIWRLITPGLARENNALTMFLKVKPLRFCIVKNNIIYCIKHQLVLWNVFPKVPKIIFSIIQVSWQRLKSLFHVLHLVTRDSKQ